MAVTALLFRMPRSRIRKSIRRMWSEVAMAHAIVENNSGRMKLTTAAKDCAVPGNTSG
jgi:ribosomal protein L32